MAIVPQGATHDSIQHRCIDGSSHQRLGEDGLVPGSNQTDLIPVGVQPKVFQCENRSHPNRPTDTLDAEYLAAQIFGSFDATPCHDIISNPVGKRCQHFQIVHPFPGYSSGATADTRTSRHNEFKVPVREAQSRSRRELFSYSLVKSSCWLKSVLSPAPAGRNPSEESLSREPSDRRRDIPPPIQTDRPRKVRNRRRRSG